jgi:hypothetical protein
MNTTRKQFKMADVVGICMKQRVMIESLTTEVNAVEIYRCLNGVYGEHTTDVSTVRPGVRHFKSGETEIRDTP